MYGKARAAPPRERGLTAHGASALIARSAGIWPRVGVCARFRSGCSRWPRCWALGLVAGKAATDRTQMVPLGRRARASKWAAEAERKRQQARAQTQVLRAQAQVLRAQAQVPRRLGRAAEKLAVRTAVQQAEAPISLTVIRRRFCVKASALNAQATKCRASQVAATVLA
jgi:hypothetical protein